MYYLLFDFSLLGKLHGVNEERNWFYTKLHYTFRRRKSCCNVLLSVQKLYSLLILFGVWLGISMSREFPIPFVDSVHSYNQSAGHLFFPFNIFCVPRTFVDLGWRLITYNIFPQRPCSLCLTCWLSVWISSLKDIKYGINSSIY